MTKLQLLAMLTDPSRVEERIAWEATQPHLKPRAAWLRREAAKALALRESAQVKP